MVVSTSLDHREGPLDQRGRSTSEVVRSAGEAGRSAGEAVGIVVSTSLDHREGRSTTERTRSTTQVVRSTGEGQRSLSANGRVWGSENQVECRCVSGGAGSASSHSTGGSRIQWSTRPASLPRTQPPM